MARPIYRAYLKRSNVIFFLDDIQTMMLRSRLRVACENKLLMCENTEAQGWNVVIRIGDASP